MDRSGSLWIVVGHCRSLWVIPHFSKYHLDACFDQLLKKLATKDDIAELKNKVTALISDKIEAQGKQISFLELRVELEAENAVLKKHVTHLIASHESQEQYSRRLCLRIDGIAPPFRRRTRNQ